MVSVMRAFTAVLLAATVLAGCAAKPQGSADDSVLPVDMAPFLGYIPPAPDMTLKLVEADFLLQGAGVDIHVRVVRPEGAGPFPVITQFTPYTAGPGAPGQNPMLDNLIEPVVPNNMGTFDREYARRGYAFAYADVRGTGDSSGCLDLRGFHDIEDAAKLTEFLGTQAWSNGNVGYIGASYPGSEAHIAAIAESLFPTGHLKAVVPVVASTSFYNYHHNDGVPYNGNHALGGTNTGYSGNAVAPTVNANQPNYVTKYIAELNCPYKENIVDHGGLDQTGAYYAWWQERNIRGYAVNITVPVLMGQGLADWNVKPDHIARYFNDLPVNKTLIAGQWGHQYPADAEKAYGKWYDYVNAFFDTHLKGIDTGMFGGSVAWVQDSDDTWHRSSEWPIIAGRESSTLHFAPDGKLQPLPYDGVDAAKAWYACPHDRMNRGTAASGVEALTIQCDDEPVQRLSFETPAFDMDTIVSGVPLVNLTLSSSASFTHLTVLVERISANGAVETARENYGYLNPTFRAGMMNPQPVPTGTPYNVTIDLYPQEDLVKVGEKLRFTISSNDAGRTIEAYDPGTNEIVFGSGIHNTVWLPIRPAHLQGLRL